MQALAECAAEHRLQLLTETLAVPGRHTIAKSLANQHFEADDAKALLVAGYESSLPRRSR